MKAVHALALAMTLPAACGGELRGGSSDASAGGNACGAPPRAPSAAAIVATRKRAYAIRQLFLGDTDRDGNANKDAWKTFGFDIDGRATPDGSSGLCQLAAGAAHATHDDGTCGIDNSFGVSFTPILRVTFDAHHDADVAAGGYTDLLVVDDIGASASASAISGALLQGAALGHAPAWDGTDAWPIDGASLAAPSADRANLALDGYVNDRVWVGRGAAGAITVLTVKGAVFHLPVAHVVVTARISDDGARLINGTISAVAPTQAGVVALASFWAATLPKVCCISECGLPPAQQFRQASDILVDGTQDSSRACDAISIGLGFEASEVQLGPIVTVPPPPDVCAADAGADG